MNAKLIVMLAGAIAVASASSFIEASNQIAEMTNDSANEMVEKASCNPGKARCKRCNGAKGKRDARWRQIVAWRKSYLASINKWWASAMSHRSRKYNYWRNNYNKSHLRNYHAMHRRLNAWVRAESKKMNWKYANCL